MVTARSLSSPPPPAPTPTSTKHLTIPKPLNPCITDRTVAEQKPHTQLHTLQLTQREIQNVLELLKTHQQLHVLVNQSIPELLKATLRMRTRNL